MGWKSDGVPWIRRQPTRTRVRCLFCGGTTAIVSNGDFSHDPGRVQLYCDSEECSAREIEVLVVRDGADAQDRRDVQALQAIDDPPKYRAARERGATSFSFDQLADAFEGDDPVARRRGTGTRP
jgi:hypothetical protein